MVTPGHYLRLQQNYSVNLQLGNFFEPCGSTNDKKASKEELDKEIDSYQEVTNQKKTRQRITYP